MCNIFFGSIESGYEWSKSRAYIENSLAKYNIELNLRSPKDNPTSRSLYFSLHSFFSYLLDAGNIPCEVDLPVYQPRARSLLSEKLADNNSRRINKSIDIIKSHLNPESYRIIEKEIDNLCNARFKIDAANDLIKYIDLIKNPINNRDNKLILNEFHTISCHISKIYVFKSAKNRINTLATIIEKVSRESVILPRLTTELRYNELRKISSLKWQSRKSLSSSLVQKLWMKL